MSEMAASQRPQFMISCCEPWAYFIVNGFKKCENRSGNVSKDAIGQYIAVHATKIKTARNRHATYQMPVVQNYLSQIEETKNICGDNEALDEFFNQTYRSILGVVQLKDVVDTMNMTKKERADLKKQHPFYGKGVGFTRHKWLLGPAYAFDDPIGGVKGVLGCRVLNDQQAVEEIRQKMNAIMADKQRMEQEQDGDRQMEVEEEKNDEDDDDDYCPLYDKETIKGNEAVQSVPNDKRFAIIK